MGKRKSMRYVLLGLLLVAVLCMAGCKKESERIQITIGMW